MIFVDIETTGIDRINCQLLSIGAVKENGDEFYDKCRVCYPVHISMDALRVNGETIQSIYDKNRKDSYSLVSSFVSWGGAGLDKQEILAGWNIGSFDALFISKAWDGTFNMDWPFAHRFVDIHSISYFMLGKSLSSDKLANELGVPEEERPHTAINGARQAKRLFTALKARNPFVGKI